MDLARQSKTMTSKDWSRTVRCVSDFTDAGERCLEQLKEQVKLHLPNLTRKQSIVVLLDSMTKLFAKELLGKEVLKISTDELTLLHRRWFRVSRNILPVQDATAALPVTVPAVAEVPAPIPAAAEAAAMSPNCLAMDEDSEEDGDDDGDAIWNIYDNAAMVQKKKPSFEEDNNVAKDADLVLAKWFECIVDYNNFRYCWAPRIENPERKHYPAYSEI